MFNSIFNAENPIFKPFGKLVDIVVLSVLWVVCSLPIVTLGPATAGLYDSAARCVRGDRGGPYARFFRTFRDNLRVGVPAGLMAAALAALLAWGYAAVYQKASVGERGVWYALYFTFAVIAVVAAGMAGYLLPALSRFEFSLGGLVGNCLKLSMAHLPSTAALGVILLGGVILTLRFWLLGFFTPCLCALLASLPLERVFRPYMPQEEEEEEEE